MKLATDIPNFSPAGAIAAPIALSARAKSRWIDIYELTKPRMNFLVVAMTMVGFFMAAKYRSDWRMLPAAILGTALCAAGASILNQYAERRYDALMRRTANRPLPSGRIAPNEALVYGLVCAVLGTFTLLQFVNPMTAALGATTLISYVLVYTPMKRYSTLNTVVGAIPGAIPPVMGWTAVTGTLNYQSIALFALLFVWQIPHFLAIAILYRDDYRAGGFKMLPVDDSELSLTSRQIVLYSILLIPVSLLPFMLGMSGLVYAIAALLLGLGFLWYAIACATSRQRLDARKLFFASIIYLPVLSIVLMLNRL